jgi:CBS domain-containing protein
MLTVGELMTTNVITLRESSSVGRAHAEMRLGRIRHFPVVSRGGDLVGVLSNLDVARALAIQGWGRAVAVREVMSKPPQTIRDDVPAWQAAQVLRRRKIGSLPVVDREGQLVGIITDTDFLEVAEQALAGRKMRRMRP